MAEQDIADLIATSDGDTTWGDDMRGAMTTLKQRRGSIASPSGSYIDQRGIYAGTAAAGYLAGVANQWQMAPYFPVRDTEIDEIGTRIGTATASAEVKFTIYSATADGWPDTRLYESAAIAAATSNVYISATHSRTFEAGKIYWLGIRHSSTSNVLCVPNAYANLLATDDSTNVGTGSCVERTLTFATAATDPFVFAITDLENTSPPIIRMGVV